MKRSRIDDDRQRDVALVLFTREAQGLWDHGSSTLVEELEEELDVFVTTASPGGRALSPAGALAAARFMGCSQAVVVAADEAARRCFDERVAEDREWLSYVVLSSRMRLDDVVRTYRAARSAETQAA